MKERYNDNAVSDISSSVQNDNHNDSVDNAVKKRKTKGIAIIAVVLVVLLSVGGYYAISNKDDSAKKTAEKKSEVYVINSGEGSGMLIRSGAYDYVDNSTLIALDDINEKFPYSGDLDYSNNAVYACLNDGTEINVIEFKEAGNYEWALIFDQEDEYWICSKELDNGQSYLSKKSDDSTKKQTTTQTQSKVTLDDLTGDFVTSDYYDASEDEYQMPTYKTFHCYKENGGYPSYYIWGGSESIYRDKTDLSNATLQGNKVSFTAKSTGLNEINVTITLYKGTTKADDYMTINIEGYGKDTLYRLDEAYTK